VSVRRSELLGIEFARDGWRVTDGNWPCAARCPGKTELVVTVRDRGVPHRMPGHHNVYCYTFLAVCTTCATGRLESFSHDCYSDPDDDPWDLGWVRVVSPDDVERLRWVLRDCPQWQNGTCDCRLHAALVDSSERLDTYSTAATVEVVDGIPRFRPA
jgi:hypothetical protein